MKHLLTTFFLALLSATCVAGHYHVAVDGSPSATGLSWNNTISLHAALKKAIPGDQIWVKQGTYVTCTNSDRNSSFIVPAGVTLLGGFSGHEVSPDARAPQSRSILSGNCGSSDVDTDNSYTVVQLLSVDGLNSIIDGFTIQDGVARSFTQGFSPITAGGGLYIHSTSQANSNHKISNCTFINNKAHNGGAVYVDAGNTSFQNCTFIENKADFNGGAVYNDGTESQVSPIFSECFFSNNYSNSGAGMSNNASNGIARPLIVECVFDNNFSLINGAAIYNITNDFGECSPIIEGCSFVGNDSVLGNDNNVDDMGLSSKKLAQNKQSHGSTLRPARRR